MSVNGCVGPRLPMPEQAPFHQMVEHGTSIKAWHMGPFKLATQIPSVAGRGEGLLLVGTVLSSIQTVALRAFIPANLGSMGGCLWFASFLFSAGMATFLMKSLVDGTGRSIDRFVDNGNERRAMLSRLDHIKEAVVIEVLPRGHNLAVSKTYAFGVGRLAKQGAGFFKNNFLSHPMKIFVKDGNAQVLEVAELPGLGWA